MVHLSFVLCARAGKWGRPWRHYMPRHVLAHRSVLRASEPASRGAVRRRPSVAVVVMAWPLWADGYGRDSAVTDGVGAQLVGVVVVLLGARSHTRPGAAAPHGVRARSVLVQDDARPTWGEGEGGAVRVAAVLARASGSLGGGTFA